MANELVNKPEKKKVLDNSGFGFDVHDKEPALALKRLRHLITFTEDFCGKKWIFVDRKTRRFSVFKRFKFPAEKETSSYIRYSQTNQVGVYITLIKFN